MRLSTPMFLLILPVAAAIMEEKECTAALASEGLCQVNMTQQEGENTTQRKGDDRISNSRNNETEKGDYFTLGVPQRMDRVDLKDFYDVLADAFEHLMEVAEKPSLNDMLYTCRLKHELCAEWAIEGRCEDTTAKDLRMMSQMCCAVCESTDQLLFLERCPMDPNAYTAYAKAGDVNKHFLRSLEKIDSKYEPQILSSPTYLAGDDNATAEYKVGGPWIITLENFVNEEEAERLIYWGKKFGYHKSTDNGGEIVEERTSREVFCDNECYTDPIIQNVMKRIVDITGIPDEHSDYFQLLHYHEGEFYMEHQDYHPHQVYSATGARILTFYIYLNDVPEGGGTNFPHLNVTVMPKRGRVAMWSNVLDEDPEEEDKLARHQALPVLSGEKFGATAWFHHRDYKNNNPAKCGR